jgi:hypothetical protein
LQRPNANVGVAYHAVVVLAPDARASARPTRAPGRIWSTSRWYWIAAIAILGLTLFLRLWRLDLVQFRDDQGALLRLAEDIVRLGSVPLAGMTSSLGVPLPGTFEYALAPIVALSRDPRVITAAIGSANAAGIAGTIAFGWRRFSPLTGVVAGLVFAANPWAVFFSRKVWSNDVLAPMAVVLLFCLDNAIVGEHVAWGIAAFPLFALGVQFHPSFALLAPLLVVLGVVMARRRQLQHVAIGLGLAALTGIPYLIYTLQTQASYLGVLVASSDDRPRIDTEGPAAVIGLLGGWRNFSIEGLDTTSLLPVRLTAVPGAIETVLLAIGVLAALILVLRSHQVEHRVRAAGLLVWVLGPMVLTIRHSIPLYDYYYLFVLPAGALLIGLGIQKLAEIGFSHRVRRILVGGALAGVLAIALIQTLIVVRALDSLTTGYVVKYGPPLQVAEQTTRELIDLMHASGGRQLSIEIDDVNDAAIGYLARPYLPEVQVVSRRRGPWNVDFSLPGQSGSAPYALLTAPQLSTPQSFDVDYADGVRALSASTTRAVTPGESLGQALTWTIDQHSPQPLTNRLVWELSVYDASGHEVRRVAGMAHDWAEVADGEVVVSWITVASAPEATQGVYQVHMNRLDPVSRKPIPAIGSSPEWSSGTVDVRRR